MNLYIRADADSKIGTGHIMRCIALAQTWKDQGNKVTIISCCECASLKERIQIEGFRFISLDHICPDSSDLINTLSILKDKGTDQKPCLVLDGYHFTTQYQKAIRDEGIFLLVIDDMKHLPLYYADILLNQNIHASDLKYHSNEDTTFLLGVRYVLLRREFRKYQKFKRQIPVRAKNILVTFGGSDPHNVTFNVIESLKFLNDSKIAVKIIIGPTNLHKETLRKAIDSAEFKVELLINPANMPELMVWADMAVSAAGSTCWELAFMGVPSIVIITTENQVAIAEHLQKRKIGLNLGVFTECSKEHISKACKTLIDNSIARASMSQESTGLIADSGTNQVIESIIAVQNRFRMNTRLQ